MNDDRQSDPSVCGLTIIMEQTRSRFSIKVLVITSLQFGLPISKLTKGKIGLAHPFSNCFTSGREEDMVCLCRINVSLSTEGPAL